MTRRFSLVLSVTFLFAAGPVGCSQGDGTGADSGGDTAGEVADLGQFEGGCEHMAAGPAQSVTAAAFGSAGAPGIAAPHTRYDVDLAAVEGGVGGDVSYPAAEATDYVIALSRDIPFQVLDASGVVVAIEESLRTGLPCEGVAVFHVVELDVGTYVLRFGPTATGGVSVVVEEASGHMHDHE
jgi:hypothetical protein